MLNPVVMSTEECRGRSKLASLKSLNAFIEDALSALETAFNFAISSFEPCFA